MDIFDSIGQSFLTIFPAVLWTSAMATLFLGLIFATTRLIGNRVNPRLIYTLWLLLGVRMCLLTGQFEALFWASIFKYLTLVWIVGAVGIFSFYCLQYVRNYRDILRHETKLPEWLHSLFLEVRKDLKVPVRPTLIVTDTDCEPLLMGTFRPVVVLPQRLVEANENSRELLRQVLRHEMTHLSGCDLWLAWLWTIAISLHWFNPLIWKAKSSFGLWREIACDWRVTSRMSDRERLEYGQTLLAMAQNSSSSIFNGAVFVSEKSCDIERRISMISKNFREMKSRFFSNFSLGIVAAVVFTATLCLPLGPQATALAAADKIAVDTPKQAEQEPPRIIKMVPGNGAKDVDPAVKQLQVTFDRDMNNKGHSWCGGGTYFPKTTGIPKWIDKRTCVLPVTLVEGKSYRLSINSKSFKSFSSVEGVSCDPVPWKFSTKGKPSAHQIPKVLKLLPENGTKDVDPKTVKQLKVTFDCDMFSGFAWCGGGPSYPKTTGDPKWIDKRTCVLPVKLFEGKSYQLSINAKNFYGFMSVVGVSCDPVPWKFSTKGEPSALQIPKVLKLLPENGTKDVDPKTVKQLKVTFDCDMRSGFAWCGGGPSYPKTTGYTEWIDKRTCVLPVKLEEGKEYQLWLNLGEFQGFVSEDGAPCDPVPWKFSTKGEPSANDSSNNDKSEPPKVIRMVPENGAKDIDPKAVKQLKVTFDRDMNDKGYSWCGGGTYYPKTTGKPKWIDKRTCALPVTLVEGKSYQLSINAKSFKNFTSVEGVSCDPVPWKFSTKGEPTKKPEPKVKPIPLSLLKSIQKKRAAINSADYSVKITGTLKGDILNESTSRFKFQGDDQWLVDISERMTHDNDPAIFKGGCDGTVEWLYTIINDRNRYETRLLADIEMKKIRLLDPLACANLTPEKLNKHCKTLNSKGGRYLGLNDLDGKTLHQFQYSFDDRAHGETTLDLWIDSKTLLPVSACRTGKSQGNDYLIKIEFEIHSLNEKYSKADFQPKNEAKLESERIAKPKIGYDKFYVRIDDGADGRMTVQFAGQIGEKGTSSCGAN
jgi:beta-lactamase regulating signal transducer with metallopeptidase domain